MDFSFSETSDDMDADFTYNTYQKAYIATLYCKDYGGACSIEVTGTITIDGKTMTIIPRIMQIPIDKDSTDNNGDGMADCWETEIIEEIIDGIGYIKFWHPNGPFPAHIEEGDSIDKLTPQDDFDFNCEQNSFFPLNQTYGDGLCIFDEYRGVIINNAHHRLNPSRRDMFYSRIGVFKGGSMRFVPPIDRNAVRARLDLDLHELKSGEYDPSSGKVNINACDNTKHQYCIEFALVDGYDSVDRSTIARAVSRTGSIITQGTPDDVKVRVYYNPYFHSWYTKSATDDTQVYIEYGGELINKFEQGILIHELGHCINLEHYNHDTQQGLPFCIMHVPTSSFIGSFKISPNNFCGKCKVNFRILPE